MSLDHMAASTIRTWPARYKGHLIEIHESEDHHTWISSAEIRKALPTLRSDPQLRQAYPTGFMKLDKGGRFFFDEAALTSELQRVGSRDSLMLLAWLDKTIIYPAIRKRRDLPAFEPMLPGKTEPSGFGLVQFVALLRSIWRGEQGLGRTVILGSLTVLLWTATIWALIDLVTDQDSYTGNFAIRQWLALLLIVSFGAGLIWWSVGLMRCAFRRHREGSSFATSMVTFMGSLLFMLEATSWNIGLANEWVQGWWDDISDQRPATQVTHDPALGRIVIRGEIGFGSAKALDQAINQRPALTLVEINSPGGYVVEGLAMAKLIEKNQMDTVSLVECASACTLLLAAGKERYLGPEVEVGFHRSHSVRQPFSTAWTRTDHQIADYYRSRDTSDEFIRHALDTPSYTIWIPDHGRMFAAGYATKRWDERKPGY